MNSASVADNSHYPKICEVKYDSRTKFYDCYDYFWSELKDIADIYYYEHFEFESEEDELCETSLFDLKDQGFKVEKLKWRIPVNRENSTMNRDQIKSVLEVNSKARFEVPTNSTCSTDRSISTSRHSIKIDQSLPQISIYNKNKSSIPVLKKAHTQFNLRENKLYPRILKPVEKKPVEQLPSPRLAAKVDSQSKFDISSSQKSFNMPPIQPMRKENTKFLHFVTNPYSFSEKPKLERKLINYPAMIRTKKYVPLEQIRTQPKQIMSEEKKIEIEQVESHADEWIEEKSKKVKNKAKKNSKKKNKKKKTALDEDSEDSLSDGDPVENIEPTTSQNTRPLGAQLANRRMREKIRFENARIQEFSESESDEQTEDLKDLEIEMEQIEKKVQQEQEELSNYEYKTDFKPIDINIKSRQKKITPFIKPQLINKTEQSKNIIPRKIESPIEEEKNQKQFYLKPLQRPFRIPENDKLLGKNTEEFVLEDDWLLKWCILENHRNLRCEAAFNKYDTRKRGFLNGEDLIQAIESIVKLNNLKMTYLFSVLNLVNVDALIFGADSKLFTIIVSLANRISHLDDNWFSNLLPQYDLFTVENKVFKVKNLWSYLVDQETKLICIKDVLIEFEAGGVTSKHVEYAKEKFSHKIYFDIVDYLTYIPLFVHIHDKIIRNPLIIKQDI